MTVGSRVDRGEMHSVRLVAQDLSSVEEFRNGLLAVRDGMNHLEEAGHSQAVSRLRTVAAPMQHSIEAIAQVRVRAGEILFRYAAQVLDLQDQAHVFRLRRSQAQDLQRRHTAALFEIRADTSPEAGGRALRMESQVEDTRASLSQIERGLAELDQARVSLDRSCARDLTHCREALARVNAGPSGSGNLVSDGLTGFADFAARMVVNAENVAAPELERILRGDRTPEQVAELWAGLDLDSDGIAALPIKDILTLANTDGLPFWVRDAATRRVLDYALKWPTGAFHLLGFAGDALADADAVAEFVRQIEAYDRAGREAEERALDLSGVPEVQLLGIGEAGGKVVGAISTGNVDTATHVGVNVPGMNADMFGLDSAVRASESLYRAAKITDEFASPAMIAWFGYRTPGVAEVVTPFRAQVGAYGLAEFLNGIGAARAGSEAVRVGLMGHSYGSTTAALALAQTRFRLDSFTTYGSAGLPHGIKRDGLNVKKIFATEAEADYWAKTGRFVSGRNDPRDLDGVKDFSAEGGRREDRVTVHDMFTDGDAAQNDGDVGYLSGNTGVVNDLGHILIDGKPR